MAFIFDFDGVVIDSVAVLRKAYFHFLDEFGVAGSEFEFQQLNGPKLTEIISLLKRWHRLPGSEEELFSRYMRRIREYYPAATPFNGVSKALMLLAERGIPVALATASPRHEVERLLARNGLLGAFAFVVTGDEVERAKPCSDIYVHAKNFFPDRRCIVLEDSENGMKAALDARLETIFFDPERSGTTLPVTASLNDFGQFSGLLEDIRTGCFALASCAKAEVRIVEAPMPLDAPTEARIAEIWERESQKHSLTDGDILCYAGHRLVEEKLQIDAYHSRYRNFVAQFLDETIPLQVRPLGVSGLIRDPDGKTLAARRGKVTEYPGRLELVPSGGIDASHVRSGRGDFTSQILEELEEETGIHRSAVSRVSATCLIHDAKNGVVDLGCVIELNADLASIFPSVENEEYQHFEVLSLECVTTSDSWVPTSGALLRNHVFASP